jgi:hypothetical protein
MVSSEAKEMRHLIRAHLDMVYFKQLLTMQPRFRKNPAAIHALSALIAFVQQRAAPRCDRLDAMAPIGQCQSFRPTMTIR